MLKTIAFGTAIACIPATAFLIFSFHFSLGPLLKYKELKNNRYATWFIAVGMFLSLFIILAAGNFFVFHFPWAWFLPTAILGSMLVASALKIGPYKTIKREIQRSERHIQKTAEIIEAQTRHNEYPFTSPEETNLAVKRWETS